MIINLRLCIKQIDNRIPRSVSGGKPFLLGTSSPQPPAPSPQPYNIL